MGIACACQKVECEEETIERILSSMILSEIESKSAYYEFIKCVNKDDGYLDFFLFKNYVIKIIGENNYKIAQNCFFENLRKLDHNKRNIRRIGALIIFLSKGSKSVKIDLLNEHFSSYYNGFNEKSIKEFVNDMIDTNTDNCIISFRESLGNESIKGMVDIYRKGRKKKLLNYILLNYEGIKLKYFTIRKKPKFVSAVPLSEDKKLNTSFDVGDDLPNLSKAEETTEGQEKYCKSQREILMTSPKMETDEDKIMREFFELSYNQLAGEYIRNWLYDDYLKEKPYENICL